MEVTVASRRFARTPLVAALPMIVSLFPAGSGGAGASPEQQARALSSDPVVRSNEPDDYTRYELLAADTAQFRIVYEVTATEPGSNVYFNSIRRGSEASDEAVYDRMTGARLQFDIVGGAEARKSGLAGAGLDTQYIRVRLPRMVPKGGEVRLRIDKTYKDPKTYYREGTLIVFSRPLGIKRNAVVLPAGYALVSCNYPSQVLTERDGRINVSFWNIGSEAVPFVIKARKTATQAGTPAAQASGRGDARAASPSSGAASSVDLANRLVERAHQDREIVYFLHAPETHAFRLYHDYTESRPGTDRYLNVVRQGSRVSDPAAWILDTGEQLRTDTFEGEAIGRAGLDIGQAARADSQVVVVRFPPVKEGQSVRLRIEETYTDPARYYLAGDELVWDRGLGRPLNAVVLPEGWRLTGCSIPATIRETPDGRIRLDFVNPRPDEIAVLLTAQRGRQAG
jgi:hypothetical protein